MTDLNLLSIIEEHQKILLPYTAALVRNKHILDIGTGNGINAHLLHKKLGSEVELCDIVDIRAEYAKNYAFQLCSAEHLPHTDNSFEITHLQYVLHHLPLHIMLTDVLTEATRVAKEYVIIIEETRSEQTNVHKAEEFDRHINSMIHPQVSMPIYRYFTHNEILESIPTEVNITTHLISSGNAENGFLETRMYILEKRK